MSKTDNLTDFLTDLANAIRTVKGTTELINPQDFADEILALSSATVAPAVGVNLRGKTVHIETLIDAADGEDGTYFEAGGYRLGINYYWEGSSPNGDWGDHSDLGGDMSTGNVGCNIGNNMIHIFDSGSIDATYTFPDDQDYIITTYNMDYLSVAILKNYSIEPTEGSNGITVNIA